MCTLPQAEDSATDRTRPKIPAAATIIGVCASALVLVGWQFGIAWLKSPFPNKAVMVPNTALCVLLVGVSLWLQRDAGDSGWKLRSARACGGLAVVLALLFVAETVFKTDFGIDRILFHSRMQTQIGGFPAGRPALNTSLSLLLLGLSALFVGIKRLGWYVSELLCIPALFVGFLGVTGYALGAQALFQAFPALTPMSVYTALCICSLSVAAAFINPKHRISRVMLSSEAGGVVARTLLPFCVATVLLLGWLDVIATEKNLVDVYLGTALLVAAGSCMLAVAVMWTAGILNHDAAARRRAEQTVAYLRDLVESSEDAIIGRTLSGTITSWNQGAEHLYGYCVDEVVGRSADFLLPSGQRNELDGILQSIARGERIGQYETRRRCKDGRVIDVAVRVSPITDATGKVIGASGIARDVTENKRAEAELRRAKDEWEQTFNNVPDLISILDPQNRIVRVNRAMAERLGTTPDECTGATCFRCVHDAEAPPEFCPHARTLRDSKAHVAEVREEHLGGDFVVSTTPLFDEQGELTGIVHVARDVSEQKRAEAALIRSEKLATTGRMAATIAHEIHNPLDAVGNLLYLAQMEAKEDATREFITMASKELERVTQMTHQMLAFQREAAAPVLVHIQDVLNNVLAIYERKIQTAGVTIEQEIEPGATILALPGETRQVFANLIGNAIEAAQSNGGRICLRAHSSRDYRGARAGMRLVVADNGRGMSREVMSKIFEPFFTTKGESGTGLGLWITSSIVEKFGGTMKVRSTAREGRSGTCFSVFFPISEATRHERIAIKNLQAAQTEPDPSDKSPR